MTQIYAPTTTALPGKRNETRMLYEIFSSFFDLISIMPLPEGTEDSFYEGLHEIFITVSQISADDRVNNISKTEYNNLLEQMDALIALIYGESFEWH